VSTTLVGGLGVQTVPKLPWHRVSATADADGGPENKLPMKLEPPEELRFEKNRSPLEN
jgi:hypothetical protein